MRCQIAPNLEIEIKSVAFDFASANWTVVYEKHAFGMKSREHYGFTRYAFTEKNSVKEVANALVEILTEKVGKL